MFDHILVPVDFSETSVRALEAGRDLAAEHGAKLTVFHVGDIQRALGMTWSEEFFPVGPEIDEITHQEQIRLQGSIERIARDVVGDATPEVIVRMGHPAQEICDQVTSGGHDLVVMGTHGRTGLRRALLGSVAERVLHHSEASVLVIH